MMVTGNPFLLETEVPVSKKACSSDLGIIDGFFELRVERLGALVFVES